MRNLSPVRLLAALVALCVAAPAFAGNGASLLQYLPSSSQVVVGVNVERLRGSALWTQALDVAGSEPGLRGSLQTLTDAGFDPRATAQTVVVASNRNSGDLGESAIAIVEVAYPREALVNVLVQDGYTLGTDAGATHYRKGNSTVAFLSDTVLAVGEHSLVAPSLSGPAGAAGRVRTQLSAVDKSGAIWAVGIVPAGNQGAQAARVAIDLSAGLRVGATLLMESEEAANAAATSFNTQIAAVAASPEVAAFGVAPLLAGVQAQVSGAELSVAASMAAAEFNALVTRLAGLAREELR